MIDIKEIKKSFKQEHLESPIIRGIYYPVTLIICYICLFVGISPNGINIIGVLLNIVASIIILLAKTNLHYVFAGAIVFIAYTTDFCDGTLARYYRNKKELQDKVTPIYGKWSDEIAGLIGAGFIFSAGIIKTLSLNFDSIFLFWGLAAIIGFMMVNFAAVLGELIRKRFEIENAADSIRKNISKKFFGINPRNFAFGFEIQWSLIILAVIFNQFYILFVIFAILANLQWIARYYIYFGK